MSDGHLETASPAVAVVS